MADRRIWKFPLRGGEGGEYFAEMPGPARVLSAGWQSREFVVWAVIIQTAPLERCRFHVAGTGYPLPPTLPVDRLVGRVEIPQSGSPLIFHVFDLGEATWPSA